MSVNRPGVIVVITVISLFLTMFYGCNKDFDEETSVQTDKSRSNNNPGEPYKINVKKIDPGEKIICFGIIADNHVDCSDACFTADTDAAERNRVTVGDINIDCKNNDCLGIIQLGDLVNSHTSVQNLIAYRQMWENDYPGHDGGSIACASDNDYTAYSNGNKVNFPVFPTIGNHGSQNPGEPIGIVAKYIQNRIQSANGILSNNPNMSRGTYCWRWGQYFFVQLGMWAGSYEWEESSAINQAKLDWLEQILEERVGNSNLGVIICQHYGWDAFSTDGDWWTSNDRELELNVLCRRKSSSEQCNPYNVIAIFTGHAHLRDHKIISVGIDSTGNNVSFNNYIIPDVGKDNNNQRGHAFVKLTENDMALHIKNRHNNTWSIKHQDISTGPPSPNPFRFVVGFDVNTNGQASSWGPVHKLNENQPYGGGNPAGGGAEIFDINNNNIPDLVLMGINYPVGRNQFYYDIYWDINNDGTPGSQKNRVYVPTENLDIGSETAGGGVALADINNNGIPDILLMSVTHNYSSMNSFRYVIGWDINTTTGEPANWDELVKVSNFFDIGWRNDGGGVALYDIDDNGILDLVLMAITRNSGPNNARYLIAWNINPSNHGYPTSGPSGNAWSNLVQGPKHFGWDSSGGGLAIADIDKNGRPEFVILNINNHDQADTPWYDIAWNIDLNGEPTTGGGCTQAPCWSLIKRGESKFSYHNKGAGCTVYDLDNDGNYELFFTALDEPFNFY